MKMLEGICLNMFPYVKTVRVTEPLLNVPMRVIEDGFVIPLILDLRL